MSERRSTKRWNTILTALVKSDNQLQSTECVVRDLSDTGAKVYFAGLLDLPAEFELVIPSRGLRVRSRLMWSQGANHGVMFLEEVRAWTDPLRSAA
jgi:hypothetical protein